MRITRRTTAVSVATAATLVLAGGVAYAYWTTTAQGDGAALSRSNITTTVTAAAATADLYPGGTGAVKFTLDNPNPYDVSFTSVTAASVVSDNTGACPNSNISINPTLPHAISIPVAAGATATPGSVAGLVKMAAAAGNGCQGVGFTVTLTLAGSQV